MRRRTSAWGDQATISSHSQSGDMMDALSESDWTPQYVGRENLRSKRERARLTWEEFLGRKKGKMPAGCKENPNPNYHFASGAPNWKIRCSDVRMNWVLPGERDDKRNGV